jgi:hypothetical protein
MSIRELDSIVLERDLPEDGLRNGDLGAVVHVHSADAFDIEFVRASGTTQALVQLTLGDSPRRGQRRSAVRSTFSPRCRLTNAEADKESGELRRAPPGALIRLS